MHAPDVVFQPTLLAETVESLAEGVVLLDTEGLIFYVNPAVVRALGLPPDQVLGRRWDDPVFAITTHGGQPIPVEDRPFRAVMRSGERVLGYEYDMMLPTGRRISVILNAVPLRFDGRLIGVALSLTDVTDRVRVEEELRESDERFRAMVEQSRYGLFVARTDGHTILYNPAMEQITGIAKEHVQERGWFAAAFPDPEERLRLEREAERTLRGEVPFVETQYRRPDGRELWIAYGLTPLRLGGEPYVLGMVTDVSERKRAEEAARESDERFRAMLEQSRYGMFISSSDGRLLAVNHAMEEITGNPNDEVIANGWPSAFRDPEQRRAIEESMQRPRTEPVYEEMPYERLDGRRIWLSFALNPLRIHGREYTFGIVADITERKRSEERVRFQSALLDQIHEAVVATDLGGRITYVNDEAEELLGWSRDDVLGRVAEQIAPSEHLRDEMTERLRLMERWEGETLFTRDDGRQIPLLVSLGMLKDESDNIEGYVSVAVDLTEQKVAQRALEEKDRAIRQAYVDVVGAVTGGKLVLMTEQELGPILGHALVAKAPIDAETLCGSRHEVEGLLAQEHTVIDPSEGVVAFGEAATNAIKHGGGGRYCVYRKAHSVQVMVQDEGPGIDFRTLPRATLLPGFSTQASLGMGFTIMLDLADRVLLTTHPGCTEVVLEFATR